MVLELGDIRGVGHGGMVRSAHPTTLPNTVVPAYLGCGAKERGKGVRRALQVISPHKPWAVSVGGSVSRCDMYDPHQRALTQARPHSPAAKTSLRPGAAGSAPRPGPHPGPLLARPLQHDWRTEPRPRAHTGHNASVRWRLLTIALPPPARGPGAPATYVASASSSATFTSCTYLRKSSTARSVLSRSPARNLPSTRFL